jgi:hypothetical protein
LALAAESSAEGERCHAAFWLGVGFAWLFIGPLVGFLLGRVP